MKQFNFLIFLLLVSCSRIQTLNTEPHFYSQRPNRIIWLQIPGFSLDHIPLLKFNSQLASFKTWFEKADCVGKVLTFNLYELRPDADKSLIAQVLGSKNIKKSCEDFDRHFVWREFSDNGYKVSVLENGFNKENSLEKYSYCDSKFKSDFQNIRMWEMASSPYDKNYFHYQDSKDSLKEIQKAGIYFDKSCKAGTCYSTVLNNLKSIYGNFINDTSQTFLLIRDNTYLKAMQSKNLGTAREALMEYDQVLKWLTSISDQNTLILVSSSEAKNIEFPQEGKEWESFMKSGKNFLFKNTSLTSDVIASGATAENFCGVFEESELAGRILFQPPRKKFSWDAINPFSN